MILNVPGEKARCPVCGDWSFFVPIIGSEIFYDNWSGATEYDYIYGDPVQKDCDCQVGDRIKEVELEGNLIEETRMTKEEIERLTEMLELLNNGKHVLVSQHLATDRDLGDLFSEALAFYLGHPETNPYQQTL